MADDGRELGLAEIKARLKNKKTELGLARFVDTPSGEVDPNEDLPAIFLLEDEDVILNRSGRTKSGYPAKRNLTLSVECTVNSKEIDPRTFCKAVRKAIFLNSDGIVDVNIATGVYMNEDHTEGPFGYGLPNVNGMRLVLNLIYNDEGII